MLKCEHDILRNQKQLVATLLVSYPVVSALATNQISFKTASYLSLSYSGDEGL